MISSASFASTSCMKWNEQSTPQPHRLVLSTGRSVLSMTIKVPLLAVLAAASSLVATEPVSAHGFAGKRFFPATLATDDPFVADELSLPTIAYSKQPASEDSPATRQTDFSIGCYCENEDRCHRSILRDLLIEHGAEMRES